MLKPEFAVFASWRRVVDLLVFAMGGPLLLLLLLAPARVVATGSADLFLPGQDPVMLLVGDPAFGNFATYTAAATNRINVAIAEAGEVIYLGLSRAYRFDGMPQNFGQYSFRIRRLEDNQVVHGPFTINALNESLPSWEAAHTGPAELAAGGYTTTANYRYVSTQAGTYIVEFENVRYLGLWDITVAANGVEKPGRVYSQNWAFRVPGMDSQLPDCIWGAELNSRFYSYTIDGFVTLIDFENSGFQPLSFNLAFNQTGPGQTGDLQLDRMSVANQNLTASSAEHFIFIDEPDPILFPDGDCGILTASDQLRCIGEGSYCLPINVSRPGQVEVILDFNGNQVFDPGTDVLLVGNFTASNLSDCLPWDGLLPDGSSAETIATVDIFINYTQGVQHWALYDGELMREGFCVRPIRPICGGVGNAQLYYDDRNIADESGTNAPKDGRLGCDCESADCRTWTNFEANTTDCNLINDEITTGYGDKNTLNTWWFANVQSSASFSVPLLLASIAGPADHCPDEEVSLQLVWQSSSNIENIVWEGPGGFGLEGPGAFSVAVTTSGLYTVRVSDQQGCVISATYFLPDVVCTLTPTLVEVVCSDNGTDTDPSDDTFTAVLGVNGGNSNGWSANGGSSSGLYGTTITVGPFPISGGEVTYTFTDELYGCCTASLVVPVPVSCSNGCAINQTQILNNLCNNNGTLLDPTDDTFTFEVLVDGINLSGQWSTNEGQSGMYGTATTFGPYPIAAGTRTLVFTDSQDPSCGVTVEVTPPATCSNDCLFTPVVSNIRCHDASTPSNPTDDEFFFDLRVDAVNATSAAYQIEGLGLAIYGSLTTYGPFSIAAGDLMLVIQDVANPSCFQSVVVPAPSTCSEACLISQTEISNNRCEDGGTPLDGSDDTFTFEVLVDGFNVSGLWVTNEGQTGAYGVANIFGPYPIAAGTKTIIFTDSENPSCGVSVEVIPPASCSNECLFTPIVSNVRCEDAGTPYNPTDDQFFFDLFVSAVNATSAAYAVDGLGIHLYEELQTFGPFPIQAGDLNLQISDVVNTACNQTITVVAPSSCSDLCGIVIEDVRVGCDDAGTALIDDDVYYYEVLVSSLSSTHTTWVASDGSSGNYGEYSRSIDYSFFSDSITIDVMDAAEAFCVASFRLAFSAPTLSCPEDVDRVDYNSATYQTIPRTITDMHPFYLPTDTICWLLQDSIEQGRHYVDRLTFRRADTTTNAAALFTFYLFSDLADSSAIGALFRLSAQESIDCCNLINPGVVRPWNEANLRAPYLQLADYPEGMLLSQQFSALLNPREDYTLAVSSWSADTIGSYTWLVVSTSGELLLLRDNSISNSSVSDQATAFDLYTFHLSLFRDQASSMAILGFPEVEEGCGVAGISPRDEVTGDCTGLSMSRRFLYQVGASALQTACRQEIALRHLGLDAIILPAQGMLFTCSDTFPQLENGHPHPNFTGWPMVYNLGQAVVIDSLGFVDLSASFLDQVIERPDGGRTIYRLWTLADACLGQLRTYTQLLKLDASGEPYFDCPLSNHYCPIIEEDIMLFPTDSFECTATVFIPWPALINICDTSAWTITSSVYQLVEGESGQIDTVEVALLQGNDNRYLPNLPTGDYFIYYSGIHATEPAQSVTCRFRVADIDPPSPICRSLLNLSLPGSGIVRIFPQQINRGSYDNCGDITIQLRRRYAADSSSCALQHNNEIWSAWHAYVEFSCCDVGRAWEVEMLVTDRAGNSSFCVSEILVVDNTLPYCTGLVDTTILCSDLPQGFNFNDTLALQAYFGYPIVVDNCASWAIELAPILLGDACNPTRVERRFLAVDEHGNQASRLFTQTILVNAAPSYSIRFPRDTSVDCTAAIPLPVVFAGGCDSITIAYAGASLPNESSACRYIARTYTITNWCEWDGQSPAVVIDRDEDCNGQAGDQAVWLLRLPDTAYVDADSLAFNLFPTADARGVACSEQQNPEGHWRGSGSTGRWEYTQYIRIFDETPPVLRIQVTDSLCVDSITCLAQVNLAVNVFDYCQEIEGTIAISWDIDADGTIDGSLATQPIDLLYRAFPYYRLTYAFPVGRHAFLIEVTDDCGNTATEQVYFDLFDCHVPDLVCSNGELYNLQALTEVTDIDNDGEIDFAVALVEAADLGSCFQLECSEGLRYSVNRVGEAADINRSSLYLKCSDRYQAALEIYVWDEAYNPFSLQPDGTLGGPNWKKCEIWVFVQDPYLACPSCGDPTDITIAGTIQTVNGVPLAEVAVQLVGKELSMLTTSAGQYQFRVVAGEEYTVHASKSDDIRAGLSTIDLILLQRHIMGNPSITAPHRLLAADVNADGQLNVQDLLLLQAAILGQITAFPSHHNWRFVPTAWNAALPVSDAVPLGVVNSCINNVDMVGIKLGDLDQSYQPSAVVIGGNRGEAQAAVLAVEDQTFASGETVSMAINLADFSSYEGGQLAIQWDPAVLSYEGYTSAVLTDRSFNTNELSEGLLWFNYASTLTQQQLVRFTFRAKQPGVLKEVVQLCDRCEWEAEVYSGQSLAAHPLHWVWQQTAVSLPNSASEQADRSWAVPNPAKEHSTLYLRLAVSQKGTLSITDAKGRLFNTTHLELQPGENSVRLDIADWPAGVYHFSFVGSVSIVSGKLVKM